MAYTYQNLLDSVKSRLHNQLGQLGTTSLVAINDAVRATLEVDFRTTKRKSLVAPNLFDDIYEYNCPTDLKKKKIVGIQPQKLIRSRHTSYELVPEENFDQLKQSRENILSVSDADLVRKVLASVRVNDLSLVVSPLESLTSGGTWAAFGDAENLSVDTYDYIKGSGSIKWDIDASAGTTAGIQSSDLNTFDLTNYASAGSVFVWCYLTDATNVTNFILRLGNDSSNYYAMTATTPNDGTSFVDGWNLVRFDFSGKSTTGTVDEDACDYAVIYMTKDSGKVSETDYRFDHIILKLGEINNLIYYSNYMWRNSTSITWKANSTSTDDLLNADEDEYNLIVEKCVEQMAVGIREYENDYQIARRNYMEMKKEYQRQYKSEALSETTDYYYFDG